MSKHRTTCPNCQKAFNVTLEMQGKRCKCSKCQHKFSIHIETPFDQVLGGAPSKPTVQPPPAASPANSEEVDVVEVTQTAAPNQAPVTPAAPDDDLVEVTVTPVVQTPPADASSTLAASNDRQDKVSPFEELASRLVTAHQAANVNAVYDPRKYMAYSTNANLASQDFAGERRAQMVIRGGALMLFSAMLLPLVFLGLHLSGSSLTCPTGGLIAVALGGTGSLMMILGLRTKALAALALGGFPGIGFLATGALLVFLFFNGYWGSTSFTVTGPSQSLRERAPRNHVDPFRERIKDRQSPQDRHFDDLRKQLDKEFEEAIDRSRHSGRPRIGRAP